MVLRKLFGPKRDWVTGEWGKLHNEKLNDLYCSPNIVRVIKSRAGRRMWSIWGGGRFCFSGLMERGYSEDLGIDGSIILKLIFKN